MDDNRLDEIISGVKGRTNPIIKVLLEVQEEEGWLSREILRKISRKLDVPFNEILHMVTFYKTFRLTPRGMKKVRICMGSSCYVKGAGNVLTAAKETLGLKLGEVDSENLWGLESESCNGCCALGPILMVGDECYTEVEPQKVKDMVKG